MFFGHCVIHDGSLKGTGPTREAWCQLVRSEPDRDEMMLSIVVAFSLKLGYFTALPAALTFLSDSRLHESRVYWHSL